MHYRIKLITVFILFFGPFILPVLARPAPWVRKEHADKNDDGIVDRKEKRIERNWERKQRIEANKARASWKYERFNVSNKFEKKYDYDQDGWLSPDESKDLLEDKKTIIKSKGKAKVNTAVERLYDENDDGVIDADELEEIKEDFD
ncbi:MAG: hypothetical protein K9L95_01480 [Candidatus Omnitrophica bacterium]|nr:hypothetical protein [Candidatus Omnitrophota bacterium]MCF7876831.1 hypothetical protein [Candidatus Omnitrophota bacterium]MCF7878126.1 hypothetical protein [Candidatus Omnitrophota bacterium]MCF7892969.1 hypothetical protein [Candidatus Omnitrophota bacterium]